MDYKKIIKDYADKGGSIEKMWGSVAVTEEAMNYIKEADPDKYDCLMHKLSEALYGKHYTEETAIADVKKLYYTDAAGNKHHGEHWTVDEVEDGTSGLDFPKGTTKWDKYVAYNATYADFSKKFDEDQVLDIAYLMWFDDEDWKADGKIWEYMSLNK